ncbi:YadA-like family protein [Allosphingosinicella indica]|uniref:YD repeat-containing protein n=1 Tax=Allosphingosinicella indica TaxID=941907 RepID=A0A1X7H004_9SPHN|nr:YadA-like family protein [Allosphingosinicella indica]SMF77456.1 YD repeat-containing protein [Allosphingosinicella indica]
MRSAFRFTLLATAVVLPATIATSPAGAQTSLVGACSGVSLPRSVVTDIMRPVVTGIASPLENRINSILNVVAVIPIVGQVLPPLNLNATGLLNDAATGAPITLSVLDRNGNIVGPNDRCDLEADSLSLADPAGIAIGGNRISGLGANGAAAFAADIDAIAFGNGARAEAGAVAAIALGQGASVTAANSVAIGAGSEAGRGAQLGYTAFGLAAAQDSAGEFSVGAVGAERQITNVAAGSADSDAVNVAQLRGVAAMVGALGDEAVTYDDATRGRVTLAGVGGTIVTNVAAGSLSASSSDAVNGSQLFATNQQVGANTTAIAINTTAITNVQGDVTNLTTIVNDQGDRITTIQGDVTNLTNVVTNQGDRIVNVEGDIVDLSTQVTNNTTAIANLSLTIGGGGNAPPSPARYSDPATPTVPNAGTVTDEVTLAGASGGAVGLHNVRAGTLATGSTDAVNGGQLHATNQEVARLSVDLDALSIEVENNRIAITNITNNMGNAGPSPVRYSDAASPTTPNGGQVTDDVTLAGASGGPVGLHNVRDGVVAAGSTDAVNGGQLHAVSQQAADAAAAAGQSVRYDYDASGNRTNRVTLAGGDADASVTVANVAAGTVAAGSTEAVNGGQLFSTNQAVSVALATAEDALALGSNSVQYDPGRGSVTFAGGGTPVVLQNVAAGVATTDAVNVGQLNAGLAQAVADANAYTDLRLENLGRDMVGLRRDANGGTAGALAAAALPQAFDPGGGMIAMGFGTFQGQSAFALGASAALNDAKTVVKVGVTYDTRGRGGANAGVGFSFR